jgi:hypothetical protein
MLRKRKIIRDEDLIREDGTWANLAALGKIVTWSAGMKSKRAIAYCAAIVRGETPAA